jgi:hypothetical protein
VRVDLTVERTRPVLYTVLRPGLPPLAVEADDHRVEGAHHVFRRDTTVLSRPRSVVVLRLPVGGTAGVLAQARPGQDPAGMSRRFDVPLGDLEAAAHVPAPDQVEEQQVSRPAEPLRAGPHLPPYGDGATGADGDGD